VLYLLDILDTAWRGRVWAGRNRRSTSSGGEIGAVCLASMFARKGHAFPFVEIVADRGYQFMKPRRSASAAHHK
jgi:hypothetical protein